MSKAKAPKPLESYYAGRVRVTYGGVPMRIARPLGPAGSFSRTSFQAASRAAARPGPWDGRHQREAAEAYKAWRAEPVSDRLALQDAALSRVSVAPVANIQPERPEIAPPATIEAPEAPEVADAPQPDALAPDCKPVAAGPAATPEAPAVTDSLAALLRAAADKVEALEAEKAALLAQVAFERHAAECAEQARQEAVAKAEREAHNSQIHAERGAKDLKDMQAVMYDAIHNMASQREGRRRALLALRAARAKAGETATPARPEPVAPAAMPAPAHVDAIAQKRDIMRRMGIDSGWRLTTANPAANVRAMTLEAA